MNRILILAILLAMAMPAQAGWKMYTPGQKEPAVSSTETEREAERRNSLEQHRLDYLEYVRATNAINARSAAPRKQSQPICTPEELNQVPSCPPARNKYNDGPRPGGHQRHEWREQTGFNTPAERTRYRMEVHRLNSELKKEKARPNPAGAHPEEIRKQHMPKF